MEEEVLEEEEPEPVFEMIEDVEILVTDQAEMYISADFYTQFTEEIKDISSSPTPDKLRIFLAVYYFPISYN